LKMLDDAREFADVPFTITSSWRSKAFNMEVKGKPNSAHLRGTAIDISCMSSYQRLQIVNGLLDAGFTRVGIAKTFIHADCDMELPQEVMWIY
jgi:zinc D-Ala-D-Ala carboxypeptidase